ncbi:MAG: S41 family peptidase [Armatimonadota bacterium]
MKFLNLRLRAHMLPAFALLLIVTLLPLAAPHAQAADAGLVLEALRQLRARYVEPVDSVALLNGAIGGLKTSLSAAGAAAEIPEITSGSSDPQAEAAFRVRFDAATAAAGTRVTPTALSHAAIRSMTAVLKDSHTGFVSAEANRERQLKLQGQAGFTGAGIVLMPREGRFYVRDVVPGSPAQAAGVQQLDRIVRVDNVSTTGLQVDQLSGMIRGPAGTAVSIILDRPGRADPVNVTVTRAPIQVPSIFQTRVMDGGVGYLQLYQFSTRTGTEFRDALQRMLAGGMRALILDVRANSGGYVHELALVLNTLLLPGRAIYQEITRGGASRTVRTSGAPILPSHVPVVVLLDEASASAAELLAAALQEHGRATLMGAKSSGAVEASIVVDLSDGSALSITILRLASGSGKRLEGVGVAPDVQVAQSTAELDQGRDSQLQRAHQLARQRLGQAQQRVPAASR